MLGGVGTKSKDSKEAKNCQMAGEAKEKTSAEETCSERATAFPGNLRRPRGAYRVSASQVAAIQAVVTTILNARAPPRTVVVLTSQDKRCPPQGSAWRVQMFHMCNQIDSLALRRIQDPEKLLDCRHLGTIVLSFYSDLLDLDLEIYRLVITQVTVSGQVESCEGNEKLNAAVKMGCRRNNIFASMA